MAVPSVAAMAPLVAAGAAAGSAAAVALGDFASRLMDAIKRPDTEALMAVESGQDMGARPLDAANPMTVAGLRSRLQDLLSRIRARVGEGLAAAGLSLPTEMRLGLDELGDVRVSGGSAGRQEIEAVLQRLPGLSGLLAAAGHTTHQLEALGAADNRAGPVLFSPPSTSIGAADVAGAAPRSTTVVLTGEHASVELPGS